MDGVQRKHPRLAIVNKLKQQLYVGLDYYDDESKMKFESPDVCLETD